MRSALIVVALVALLAAPALANDLAATPIADHPGAGHIEGGFIFWDLGGPPGPSDGKIYEAFIGVTDRLDVDLERWDFDGLPTMNVVNAYYHLVKETPTSPSLVIGATNLTQEDIPPSPHGMGFSHQISPCVLSAFNIRMPQNGPPSLNDPLVRVYAGWGTGWHEEKPFGGIVAVVHPAFALSVFNYQGQPAYLATLKPSVESRIDAGWFHGQPIYHLAYNVKVW